MADIPVNPADRKIIAELETGRNLPSNIADEIDLSNQYVRDRLDRLEEHGVVVNVGRGVYELIEEEIPPEYYEDDN